MVKFDVVVGNPPYQGEASEGNKSYSAPIYPDFIDAAYKVAKKIALITPGRFLLNAGGTKKAWNKKMLDDEHVKVLFFEMDSAKVFDNTDITGGVAVTYRDNENVIGPIGTFVAHKQLNSTLNKVTDSLTEGSLMDISYSASSYRFSDEFFNEYTDNSDVMLRKHDTRLESNVFDKVATVFSDGNPDDSVQYAEIIGLFDRKRTTRWIEAKNITGPDNFKHYKVLLPKSNGSGAIGEGAPTSLIGRPIIGKPFDGHTRTFISIGNFITADEANNCLLYIKTKFTRALLGTLKVTQSNHNETWKHIPLQDFTKDSDIDWTKSIAEIDQQLYAKYCLSEEEITFIETHVKEMD